VVVIDIKTGLHQILLQAHNALQHIGYIADDVKYNASLKSSIGNIAFFRGELKNEDVLEQDSIPELAKKLEDYTAVRKTRRRDLKVKINLAKVRKDAAKFKVT